MPQDQQQDIDNCVVEQEKFICSSKELPNMKDKLNHDIGSVGE